MKSVSLHKENAYLFVFLMMSVAALIIVQRSKIDITSQQTSTVLTAHANQLGGSQNAQKQEVTTKHFKGDLISTDMTPEVGKEVTFHLAQYTPDPAARYYLRIGSKKMPFNSGSLKHTFRDEGMVNAELYCSFEGQDYRLDGEQLEVTKEMQIVPLASGCDN